MKSEKKIILTYTIELLVFSVVFLVLGILELLKVITFGDTFKNIFKYATLVGAALIIGDFIWMMVDKKRRARNCLLDKVMMLPLAIYLIVFDIMAISSERPYEFYQIGVPLAFFYISCAYGFQGIYHYYKPLPSLLEEAKKAEEEKNKVEIVEKPIEEIHSEPSEQVEEKKED